MERNNSIDDRRLSKGYLLAGQTLHALLLKVVEPFQVVVVEEQLQSVVVRLLHALRRHETEVTLHAHFTEFLPSFVHFVAKKNKISQVDMALSKKPTASISSWRLAIKEAIDAFTELRTFTK